jgi:hypothetical protein
MMGEKKWLARCPVHDDRTPSLSIRDAGGKVLVHCHAGCEPERVIAILRLRGLWRDIGRRSVLPSAGVPIDHKCSRDDTRRREAALAIWRSTSPAKGTCAATYLASRGIVLEPPCALRFHGGLKHPSGGVWPAMVALVTRGIDDKPIGIHRTFLSPDGNGKAPVEPVKMMLGPIRGGAVRLGPIGDRLMIAEGIENALSAMQATGQVAWAALSTSGLRTLELPLGVSDVVLLADGDEPGESAARDAAQRWKRERRCVRIARPPRGMDFNNVLLGRAYGCIEGLA